jgi:hypothetical protein
MKNGRMTEDAEDLMHTIHAAADLAFRALYEWVGQRPKRASRMADEALALFNSVARAVGSPTREIDSPMPVEPDELRKAREARARREQELASKWTEGKIQALGTLIGNLPSSVPQYDRERASELQSKARDLAYHSGNSISGPQYERTAEAADKCLAAYNRLVPDQRRKSVSDL